MVCKCAAPERAEWRMPLSTSSHNGKIVTMWQLKSKGEDKVKEKEHFSKLRYSFITIHTHTHTDLYLKMALPPYVCIYIDVNVSSCWEPSSGMLSYLRKMRPLPERLSLFVHSWNIEWVSWDNVLGTRVPNESRSQFSEGSLQVRQQPHCRQGHVQGTWKDSRGAATRPCREGAFWEVKGASEQRRLPRTGYTWL